MGQVERGLCSACRVESILHDSLNVAVILQNWFCPDEG